MRVAARARARAAGNWTKLFLSLLARAFVYVILHNLPRTRAGTIPPVPRI